MMYFEEWESLDDLQAHLKTDHIREAREARKGYAGRPGPGSGVRVEASGTLDRSRFTLNGKGEL
jgi:Uncharacterized conserved protein